MKFHFSLIHIRSTESPHTLTTGSTSIPTGDGPARTTALGTTVILAREPVVVTSGLILVVVVVVLSLIPVLLLLLVPVLLLKITWIIIGVRAHREKTDHGHQDQRKK